MAVILDSQVIRSKKGKLYSDEECMQLCRSWVNILEDSTVGTEQKSEMLWTRIFNHYTENIGSGAEIRPWRSLEMKWREINHDVSKFVGFHAMVVSLKESGTNEDDVMEKALLMYKENHPKKQAFKFIQCWYILRSNPKWLNYQEAGSSAHQTSCSPRQTHFPGDTSLDTDTPLLVRPKGIKVAKSERAEKKAHIASTHLKASDKTMKTMARATLMKAEATMLQTYMSLFSADVSVILPEAQRFFKRTRNSVLNKIENETEVLVVEPPDDLIDLEEIDNSGGEV